MDLIRKYLVQIKAQLLGLTVSQKLLIGLLGIFMVGTIFWTVVWSAKPQMVPLIAQPMTGEQIARVEMALKGKYEYQISQDQVLVPVEQAYAIRGVLASQQVLPNNLKILVQPPGLFTPEAQNARMWNNALEMELTRYITSFPYVAEGSVIISLGQQQSLGRPPMPSTASVYIKTRDTAELSTNQVQAIAELVSGAVSGMKREDVHLIVNGQRPYHVPSGDTPMPADVLSWKKLIEDDMARKLEQMFSSFGDVKIAVNVVPDMASKTIRELLLDPKNVISKVTSETNQETISTEGGGGAAGEPGVKSNGVSAVGEPAGGGGGGRGGSTSTVSKTDTKVVVGEKNITSIVPPGDIKELTASISLPRSYFVSVYRNKLKDPKAEPKDQAEEEKFQMEVIGPELKKAAALAKNAIGAKTDEQIKVDWFDDAVVLKMPALAAAATGFASGTLPLISQYAKQGVLALVALGALGMMLRMVRRAVPAGTEGEVDTGAFFAGGGGGGGGKRKRKAGVEQWDAAYDVFGEANQGEAVLTGIELDDETLASRKMVDEVSIMIKENPENAAALVKRWMAKNK